MENSAQGSPVKVAHITTIDLSLRFLMLNQLLSLVSAGYEVTGISAPGPHTQAVEQAGIKHVAIAMTRRVTPVSDVLALIELYRLLRRERFSIVHTHTPKPALLGQLAARLAGVPVIVNTLHGLTFRDDTPRFKRRLLVLLEKACAIMSDFILSQNPDDIETFVKEGIAPREKLRHLGNGIDLGRFEPDAISESTRERLRGELGIKPGDQVIGFVGRLVVEKGVLELVTAVAEVARDVPGTRLLVIGPNESEKSDALSKEDPRFEPVRDLTIFTGLRDDMPEMFSIMDVFALPSHREGFPRAPMEAAAMRCPAVVTDVTGCRETVLDGENGYLFPKGDASALAEKLRDLLTHPERARAFGERGRKLAEERFDEQVVFRIVADTYRDLLEKKGIVPPEPRKVRIAVEGAGPGDRS